MSRRLIRLIPVILVVLAGCATAPINSAGYSVQVVGKALDDTCQSLGQVVGEGGGSFGGDLIANDRLVEYATNDARNKAGAMGATHLMLNPPQLGATANGTTSTATVTGIAYKCPQAAGAATAAEPRCHVEGTPEWENADAAGKKKLLEACKKP
ncbi:MAG: DUF4156 domain-containing protein [Deltaproteobacteria bacterium]|nr:DUF4156 domain-containing protein [Deltaproteobacteria bacterium]